MPHGTHTRTCPACAYANSYPCAAAFLINAHTLPHSPLHYRYTHQPSLRHLPHPCMDYIHLSAWVYLLPGGHTCLRRRFLLPFGTTLPDYHTAYCSLCWASPYYTTTLPAWFFCPSAWAYRPAPPSACALCCLPATPSHYYFMYIAVTYALCTPPAGYTTTHGCLRLRDLHMPGSSLLPVYPAALVALYSVCICWFCATHGYVTTCTYGLLPLYAFAHTHLRGHLRTLRAPAHMPCPAIPVAWVTPRCAAQRLPFTWVCYGCLPAFATDAAHTATPRGPTTCTHACLAHTYPSHTSHMHATCHPSYTHSAHTPRFLGLPTLPHTHHTPHLPACPHLPSTFTDTHTHAFGTYTRAAWGHFTITLPAAFPPSHRTTPPPHPLTHPTFHYLGLHWTHTFTFTFPFPHRLTTPSPRDTTSCLPTRLPYTCRTHYYYSWTRLVPVQHMCLFCRMVICPHLARTGFRCLPPCCHLPAAPGSARGSPALPSALHHPTACSPFCLPPRCHLDPPLPPGPALPCCLGSATLQGLCLPTPFTFLRSCILPAVCSTHTPITQLPGTGSCIYTDSIYSTPLDTLCLSSPHLLTRIYLHLLTFLYNITWRCCTGACLTCIACERIFTHCCLLLVLRTPVAFTPLFFFTPHGYTLFAAAHALANATGTHATRYTLYSYLRLRFCTAPLPPVRFGCATACTCSLRGLRTDHTRTHQCTFATAPTPYGRTPSAATPDTRALLCRPLRTRACVTHTGGCRLFALHAFTARTTLRAHRAVPLRHTLYLHPAIATTARTAPTHAHCQTAACPTYWIPARTRCTYICPMTLWCHPAPACVHRVAALPFPQHVTTGMPGFIPRTHARMPVCL